MISSKVQTVGLVLFGLIFVIAISLFGLNFYKNQSIVRSMQDSIKVSAYENLDHSARVERQVLKLNKPAFEQELKKLVPKNSGLADIKGDYSISYTDETINGQEGVKEISVTFNTKEREYVATLVVDKAKDIEP